MLDSIRDCLDNLLNEVTCKSRSISSVIINNGIIIGKGTNNPICDCVENAKSMGYSFIDDGNTCVRYLLGAKSGQMLYLCNARHAEQSAIQDAYNKGHDVTGSSMYMACECPCDACASAIVNAGVKSIYINNEPDYDMHGRKILINGEVNINTWRYERG